MKKSLKKGICIALAVLFASALLLSLPCLTAMAVMGIYSAQNQQEYEERMEELRLSPLKVTLRGGLSTALADWFPFVMTFADRGFSYTAQSKGYDLTVLYNFAAFEPFFESSGLFDKASSYYNSFYGAYLLTDRTLQNRAYGFSEEEDGHAEIDPDEVSVVPCYDFFELVLSDFGLSKRDFVFDWQLTDQQANQTLAGYDDWIRLEADLTVSGASHQATAFVTSYLQYGVPFWPIQGDAFAPVDMKGIVYMRYFPENQTSVFVYALCPEEEILIKTDADFLQTVKIQ